MPRKTHQDIMRKIPAILAIFSVLCLSTGANDKSVKLWDGKQRGMDLITIGHKQVTVILADGRTACLGIPILVERPSPYHQKILELEKTRDQILQRVKTDETSKKLAEIEQALRDLEKAQDKN